MRTSLIELSVIEKKLAEESPEILLEHLSAKEIRKKIWWQKKAYQLVRLLGRAELKRDMGRIHNRLMKKSEFREQVQEIFPQT